MNPDLRGQVALVTGAGRGVGRAISLALGGAGAQVILSARTASEIGAVAEEIRAMGGQAVPIPVDLASDSEIDALFAQVRARAGRLDILVNNAAVGLFGPLSELSFADVRCDDGCQPPGALLVLSARPQVHAGAAKRIHHQHLKRRGV